MSKKVANGTLVNDLNINFFFTKQYYSWDDGVNENVYWLAK